MKNLCHDPQRQAEVAALKTKLRELAAHYQDTAALRQLETNKP